MFSTATMTPSLPSISTILPFRSELAMTFTASSTLVMALIRAQHSDPAPDRQLFPWLSFAWQGHAGNRSAPFLALLGPHVHADRRPALLARNRIVAALRAWFAARDFVEVETGALQVSPGNETHLHAFATTLVAPDGASSPLYLRTSPEFACKKLLAAGERRIVEFAKVFRNRERGALHHPGIHADRMVSRGEPYRDADGRLRGDPGARRRRRPGPGSLTFRGRSADAFAEPERLTVAEAFAKFAGIDLLATLPDGKPDRAALARAATAAGIPVADDDRWGDIFSRVLVERIEASSASAAPPFSTNIRRCRRRWRGRRAIRASPSASSFMSAASNSPTALANSPTPPNSGRLERKWRRRNASMASAIRSTRISSPRSAQMPEACGIALGLDRLVMLATGAARIDQVLWTPIEERPQ
jgi:lysyl-tRNA synthetase class 2